LAKSSLGEEGSKGNSGFSLRNVRTAFAYVWGFLWPGRAWVIRHTITRYWPFSPFSLHVTFVAVLTTVIGRTFRKIVRSFFID